MKEIDNKHNNKLCFIIGAGCSLHYLTEKEKNIIDNNISICINSSIIKFPNCNYFVSDDRNIDNWSWYHDDLKKSKCTKLFYNDRFKNDFNDSIIYNHKLWYDEKNNIYYEDGLKLTKSFDLPIIGTPTSTGSAVHIAYIMGCSPIVLLGCDCCYTEGKKYFWEFNKEKKPYLLKDNGFRTYPSKNIDNKISIDKHYLLFNKFWKDFYEINKFEISIFNATRTSLMENVPRVDLLSF